MSNTSNFDRFFSSDKVPLGLDALIGKTAVVIVPVINSKNQGRVKVGGEEWKARALMPDKIFDKDEIVTIMRRDELTLFVDRH